MGPGDAPGVSRHFLQSPWGTIHYAEAGNGHAVLLLHQTPRSCDEYRDVIPMLAREFRAIAIDTLGFGDSTTARKGMAIAEYAEAVLFCASALKVGRFAVVGHHTGGIIAVEIAASAPRRVDRLVLSSTSLVDSARRKQKAAEAPFYLEPRADGSHLSEYWRLSAAEYPRDRPDLLTRLMIDTLRAGENTDRIGLAIARYEMETRLPLIECPVLLIGACRDRYAYAQLHGLKRALPGSQVVEIEDGMIPLPDQLPREFATIVSAFLRAS